VFQSPLSRYEFVRRFLSDLGDTCPKVEKKKQLNGVRSPCRWSPPMPGLVKFNVDAAVSRGGDHGAVSAVCRDANGRFLGASTRTIKGISDPATLEAIACSEALGLADDLGELGLQGCRFLLIVWKLLT
jgi:hypothetical protein